MKKTWTIHQVDTGDPDLELMYALLPFDTDENGILLGEIDDVSNALDVLVEFLATGKHAGVIPDTHPRLGHPHHTASSAAQEFGVPVSSVTKGCRTGHIAGATKDGRGRWSFPQRAFLAWLAQRPGHGGRPRGS
jgi:hypothetical protein